MSLSDVIADCERKFPGCCWSVARPSELFGGIPPKIRKKKPFEAWVTFGEFGTKSFVCVPGDGETPEAALIEAMSKASK